MHLHVRNSGHELNVRAYVKQTPFGRCTASNVSKEVREFFRLIREAMHDIVMIW